MSETMIEKVAKAIYNTTGVEGVTLTWEKAKKGSRDLHMEWARAAIEAMRTPTEEMVRAAVEATSEQVDWVNGLFGGSYDNATQVFSDAHTAAIDAALKEQTK